MVLEVIRWGRLVFVIGGQVSQTSLRDHQVRVHLDQMVFMIARREAGPHKRRPTQEQHSHKLTQNAQKRVGKQL